MLKNIFISIVPIVFVAGGVFGLTYEDVAKPARFVEFGQKTYASSRQIIEYVSPYLKQHLEARNYDRMFLASKFIDFYEQNKHVYKSPLEVLAVFDVLSYSRDRGNGICFSLTQDLYDKISPKFTVYQIGAILPNRYQQKGWNVIPHTALVIPYENPSDSVDCGYVFLDPNFDIDTPIVLGSKSLPVAVDMGAKGIWKFQLRENKIICYIFPAGCPDSMHINFVSDIMVYLLKEYVNPVDAALKTMLAGGTKISVVSRDENGKHKAHFQIDLTKGLVLASINEKQLQPVSFDEFGRGVRMFDDNFARLINSDQNELNCTVRKIIAHADLLKRLSLDYYALLCSGVIND